MTARTEPPSGSGGPAPIPYPPAPPARPDPSWPEPADVVRLRDTVELLDGPDGAPMLFESATGKYTFLSRGAAALVPQLRAGAAYAELRDGLSRRAGVPADQVDGALRPLLAELRRSALLDGLEPERRDLGERVARSQVTMPHLRLALSTVAADRVFAALARPLRNRAGAVLLGTLGVLAVAGLVAGVTTLVTDPVAPSVGPVWVVYLLIVGQLLLHETAHGVLCRYYGVAPREVGVALWLYVLPVAFVDRSEAVRLHRRWPRVAILLAGPAVDGIAIGATVLALDRVPEWGTTLHLLLLFQVLALGMNFNPMLPTDGQQALENALGRINLRSRAMTYVLHKLLRRPLPTALRQATAGTRSLYWGYGALSLTYAVLMVLVAVQFLLLLVGLLL